MLNAAGCRHAALVVIATMFSMSLIATSARAQQAPDAGTILQQQPKPPAIAPIGPTVPKPAVPAPDASDASLRIAVKGFRVEGATLIPAEELAAQLKEAVGQTLTLGQLRDLVRNLSRYYSQKGYLARALIPEQDIRDGIVTVRIIESRRGALNTENKGERIDAARVERIIGAGQPAGQPIDFRVLGRALEVLNEQPGVDVTLAVTEGGREGETDLRITTADKPLLSGSVGVNNQGSRASGMMQLTGSVSLNNPTGLFDAATLLANVTDGNTFGRFDYNLAVGDSGLRMGVNASHLNYRLTQAAFAALAPSGSASTRGLTASYPVFRRGDLQLTLSASLDHKQLVDGNNTGETGNRRVRSGSLDANGYVVDERFGGGVTFFSAGLGSGNTNQRNAGALAADSITRNTQGSYHRLSGSIGRQQSLTPEISLNLSLRGQLASRNLDSSERFSLGGPAAIRAYPAGEATGDEGWLFIATLARRLSETFSASIFFDTGGIKQHNNTWDAWNILNPSQPNRYQLSGAGIGLDWQFARQVRLSASAALPIGSNPGRDANGNNADGGRNRGHAWLGMTAQF